MMLRYIRLIVWTEVMDTKGAVISADGNGLAIRHSREAARLCEAKPAIAIGTMRCLV